MNAVDAIKNRELDGGPESTWDGRPRVDRLPGVMAEYDRLLKRLTEVFGKPRWDLAPELVGVIRC